MDFNEDISKNQNNGFVIKTRKETGGTKPLEYWGAECEYDILTDVLLGPAENYEWLNTSSLSKKTLRRGIKFDKRSAILQHDEIKSAFQSAGVKIHLLNSDKNLPYQIFARDSSFMTPYGAVITNMAQWWRRGENFRAIETYNKIGIPIYDFVTAGTFEGGDFNVIEPGCALIGWEGSEGRSQECGALQVKDWMESEGWEIFITDIDPFFVHIDLMIVMLAEKLAAVCLETIDPDVILWLKSKKIQILNVPFQETLALGCNVVALGNDRVLLPAHASTLKTLLKAEGFTIYDPEIQMISQGGGGLHCMCQSLRRTKS